MQQWQKRDIRICKVYVLVLNDSLQYIIREILDIKNTRILEANNTIKQYHHLAKCLQEKKLQASEYEKSVCALKENLECQQKKIDQCVLAFTLTELNIK